MTKRNRTTRNPSIPIHAGIIGNGKTTYLGINGLRVSRVLRLADHLTILPVRSRSAFRRVVLSHPNIIHKSCFVLFENTLTSQLRVQSEDALSLAVEAWNAQWDVLLLDAFFGCSAVVNIQSEKPLDAVSCYKEIRLTNSFLFGRNSACYNLSNSDCSWIEKHYKFGRQLLDNNRFSTAVHAIASYRWHPIPSVQLAIIWSGIEALFSIAQEISFRISLYIALFLHPSSKDAQKRCFDDVRQLYKYRSLAVHGEKTKSDISQTVEQSASLLQQLIRRCCEVRTIPDPDKILFT